MDRLALPDRFFFLKKKTGHTIFTSQPRCTVLFITDLGHRVLCKSGAALVPSFSRFRQVLRGSLKHRQLRVQSAVFIWM